MKKFSLLFGMMALFLVACEGPVGPPGFDGLDGLDGQDGLDAPLPKVIDIEGTFDVDNDFGIRYTFENNIEVLETDVVLVYLLWDQADGSDGQPIDIWRLLPQTRLLDQGTLIYNYEHTFVDVDVFLEGDFDLSTLLPADTEDQIFRIAVLPAETTGKTAIDRSNIESVLSYLGVAEADIKKVELK